MRPKREAEAWGQLGPHHQGMVAIKAINRRERLSSVQELFREVNIIRMLNDLNTVKLLEVIDTEDTLLIVMEYLRGGDLFTHLEAKARGGGPRPTLRMPPGEW